jgi:hypothetical protein
MLILCNYQSGCLIITHSCTKVHMYMCVYTRIVTLIDAYHARVRFFVIQVTGYVAMAGFFVLGLWIILTLIFRWNTYVASHMTF